MQNRPPPPDTPSRTRPRPVRRAKATPGAATPEIPAAGARRAAAADAQRVVVPEGVSDATLDIGGRKVALTNLDKPFWPERGHAKRDLLQYYADVAPVLLPHLAGRAMVM